MGTVQPCDAKARRFRALLQRWLRFCAQCCSRILDRMRLISRPHAFRVSNAVMPSIICGA